jgi:alkanesulfonate monooxygenase SsuD/methylene tetrahydromethanopterin reductase-like flavin-dependent oxidoreductase (luciferase family)
MVPVAIGRDRAQVARRIDAARVLFPALPDSEAAWRAAGFLAGSPEDISATLGDWARAGLDRALLQMLDQTDLPALEMFSRTVLPRLS